MFTEVKDVYINGKVGIEYLKVLDRVTLLNRYVFADFITCKIVIHSNYLIYYEGSPNYYNKIIRRKDIDDPLFYIGNEEDIASFEEIDSKLIV